MSHLEPFSSAERDLLVMLPYRAGLWLSACDKTGGGVADDAEKDALEGIVVGFLEDFCKSELVEEIMKATVARRAHWPDWSLNLDSVPDECARAVDLIAPRLDRYLVASYKNAILDIAFTVAIAYGEYGDTPSLALRLRALWNYMLGSAQAAIKNEPPPVMEQILNISAAEQKALALLRKALRVDAVEGLEPVSGEENSSAA